MMDTMISRDRATTAPAGMAPVRRIHRRTRGVALLLVMIGMIVCSILTAGFLATQGTSIGIARNERDAGKCRGIAQAGIDMCYWLIRNKSDWRETMNPGTWLNSVALGDGTVTVTADREFISARAPASGTYYAGAGANATPYVGVGSAVDTTTVVCTINGNPVTAGVHGTIANALIADGQSVYMNQALFLVKPADSGTFADDPAGAVRLISIGTYDNRTFTLVATVNPTGGGTVYKNGNFIQGTITVGNNDLLTAATIDSYNSSVSSYNPLLPGTNALFGSNSLANNALTVYFPSVFRGSYTAAPTAVLGSVLGLIGLGASGPASVSNAGETRNPGTVVMPNTAGLTYQGNMVRNGLSGTYPYSNPGRYDAITAGNNSTVSINASGLYYITGNVAINTGILNTLTIADGKNVVLVVDGNITVAGKVNLGPTSRLAIYCSGNINISGTVYSSTGDASHLTIFGSSSCSQFNMTGTSSVTASVYAPQASFSMPSGSPKFYGAVVAKDLTVKGTGALHFDEALRSLYVSNIIGGSAPAGTADYRLTIIGGPGISRQN